MNKFKTCGNQNGCVTGKISQLKSEFSKDKNAHDGLTPRCKSCHRELYKENRDSMLAASNDYYARNKEARDEYAMRPEVNDRRNELKRIRRAKKKATNRVLKELEGLKKDLLGE